MKIDWVPFPTLKNFLPKFFLDYIQEYDKVAPFFKIDYRKIESIALHAKECVRAASPDVVAALEAYSRRIQAPEAVFQSLAKLKAGASAVVTGQQPGLFGGPLYNIFKAVTAIQLAQKIESASGSPCVPVFWNHSDDHSLDEFAWVSFPTRKAPKTLAMRTGPVDMPAYHYDGSWTFPSLITKMNSYLALPDPILRILADSYQDSLGLSFSRLFTRLLGRLGLVVAEPRVLDVPSVQTFYERALADHKEIRTRLERTEESLERAGYAPPLKGVLGTGLYLIHHGRRTKVEYVDGTMFAAGEELRPFTPSEDRRFSPQVFLRPLLQDSIFPTCVTVGGPNEIAYLAELRELYDFFGLRMPAIFPRTSATVVEPDVERVLAKMQFKLEDLFEDPGVIQEGVLRSLQGSLVSEIDGIRERVRKMFEDLMPIVLEIDKGLQAAVQKTTKHVSENVDGFKKRVVETLKTKEEVVSSRLNRILGALRPGGELQERRTTPFYFLGVFGEPLLDRMIDVIDPFVFGHKILYP